MLTTEQWALAILAALYVTDMISTAREKRKIHEQMAKERAAAAKREAELLDRLLEKEVLSRFAQGIPVPDAVLERSQDNGQAKPVEYSGPMTPEIEQYIQELREMGKTDEWIAQQLARTQR